MLGASHAEIESLLSVEQAHVIAGTSASLAELTWLVTNCIFRLVVNSHSTPFWALPWHRKHAAVSRGWRPLSGFVLKLMIAPFLCKVQHRFLTDFLVSRQAHEVFCICKTTRLKLLTTIVFTSTKGRGRKRQKMKALHQPGVEPGANAWKALMLPLHH